MLKNTQKILIASIFVLLIGTVSAELKLEPCKDSEPLPNIGNEITIHADLNNTGTSPVTRINVTMRTPEVNICSKIVSSLPAKSGTRVSCNWSITKDTECGKNTIFINAHGGGYSLSNLIHIDVSGKYYSMVLEPDSPEIDEELKITVKDGDGKAIDGAKISLFQVFRIPGGAQREDPVDIGDVYTEGGQAKITINEAGRHKIVAEYERESYCGSVYREREVMNRFIVHGLKSTYGLDDEFNVWATDKNNNTIDIWILFEGSVRQDYYKEDMPFTFRQKSFKKGSYTVYFREKYNPVEETSSYHQIKEKITIAAGKTTSTSASSTSASSTSSKTTTITKPQLKIEINPEKDNIKVGDEITIYVTSDGKAIKDADVKIVIGISGVKEFKTPASGKVEYTLEKADFYAIRAEKKDYFSADVSFDLTKESDKIIVPENVTEEQEDTGSEPEPKEIKGNISEESDEMSKTEQVVTNESLIQQTNIESFEKSSYLDEANFKNILIICGIIIVLIVVITLLVFILKLIK